MAKSIGIISDTHDNIYLIDEVVKKLNDLNVNLVLHAGDYISPFTPTHFLPLKAKLIGVLGNNCAERKLLVERFKEINMEIRGFFTEIKFDTLKIALLHGHDIELLNSLIASGTYDVVVHGHTHEAKVQTVRRTMVINPGEVCGYLSGKSTFAVLDIHSLKVEIIQFHLK